MIKIIKSHSQNPDSQNQNSNENKSHSQIKNLIPKSQNSKKNKNSKKKQLIKLFLRISTKGRSMRQTGFQKHVKMSNFLTII